MTLGALKPHYRTKVDDVAGGAAAMLRPLVDAGFSLEKTQRDTKYQQKQFLIEQRRKGLVPTYVPDAPKGPSAVKFLLLGGAALIALIVGLVILASSTASRTSKLGVIAVKGGKRIRRVRKKP